MVPLAEKEKHHLWHESKIKKCTFLSIASGCFGVSVFGRCVFLKKNWFRFSVHPNARKSSTQIENAKELKFGRLVF